MMSHLKYLKTEIFPHFWCAGCGNGIILGALARAFSELDLARENTVVVTGIGCWGKADDYVTTNAFHGTHGRALAFATGIKLANPKLDVIVLMGDGDGVTIGGNHFIHAARRNVDITAIIANNYTYGMTGGQYSGTTPEGFFTTTSRYRHIEPGFDVCALAEAAGAGYVARSSVENTGQLKTLIKDAISHKGFALVEALSPCPTHFGRNNGMRTAVDLMQWIKKQCITGAQAARITPSERAEKFVIGKICQKDLLDYGSKYEKIVQSAMAAAEDEV